MSAQLAPLSASVTRILSLTGFPKELKTKDIQAAFSEWESVMGGFKIKWIDDTSLMIVFNDAGVAKRAYLRSICMPPATIFEASPVASIRPYDGPDAQSIIQNVNSRHTSNASRGHNARGSVSISNGNGHGRMASMSARNGSSGMKLSNSTIPEHPPSITTNGINAAASGREPSPTLPDLPSHATLSSMISSSAPFGAADTAVLNDPAVVSSSEHGPRIGDPGKRMIGAALGMRHPGLGPRNLNGGEHGLPKAMGGLTVAE